MGSPMASALFWNEAGNMTITAPTEVISVDHEGIFIRGLAEARMRNPDTTLAKYIETYITVQVCSSPAPYYLRHTGA